MTTKQDRNRTLGDRCDGLDDMAAGQLSPLAIWRLQRRIARDPALAREWASTQQLRTDLRFLVSSGRVASVVPPTASSPVPTLTLGGIVMKRRTVFAAIAVCLFCVTGAAAGRRYLDSVMSATFTDQNHTDWTIRTTLAGKIQIVDRDGQPDRGHHWESPGGNPPSDAIELTSHKTGKIVFHGYGRHAVRATNGDLLGYLDVTPFAESDQRRHLIENEERVRSYAAFLQNPEDFTDRTPHPGDQFLWGPGPGVLAGYFYDSGISYKVVGYCRITATCPTGNPQTVDATAEPLPALGDITPAMRESAARILALAPPRNAAPQIYWQIADRNDHTVVDGHWRTIARSGHFTGYGRHEVRDDKGGTILTLDVSPGPAAR
jgi:hypothetical protein